MDARLESSDYIDCQRPAVLSKAKELAGLSCSDATVAQRGYEFVRDANSRK